MKQKVFIPLLTAFLALVGRVYSLLESIVRSFLKLRSSLLLSCNRCSTKNPRKFEELVDDITKEVMTYEKKWEIFHDDSEKNVIDSFDDRSKIPTDPQRTQIQKRPAGRNDDDAEDIGEYVLGCIPPSPSITDSVSSERNSKKMKFQE